MNMASEHMAARESGPAGGAEAVDNVTPRWPQLTADLSDDQINTIYTYAYHMAESGRHNEACGLFALLAVYRPQDPKFPHAMGVCYRRLNRYQDAIRMFALAMEVQPGNVGPVFPLIECLMLLRRREQAVELLQTVVEAARDAADTATLERATALQELYREATA